MKRGWSHSAFEKAVILHDAILLPENTSMKFFFNRKSPTASSLSLLTATLIAVFTGIGNWLLLNIWTGIATSLIVFTTTYLLVYFVLDWYIFRKIKLIYKQIYNTKASKREEAFYEFVLPKKSIQDVSQDVEKWAVGRSQEILNLKKNESYRKEFLQNLSHELKTPIFAIQGYVETLLNGALENPKVNRRFLENSARNIQRLARMVSDLDEITQLESGQRPLYKENFIIQDIIRDVFESLSIVMQSKQIKSSIKWGCENPVVVFADKEKIRQVIINLVSNSIKYGKTNGNIIASVYKTDDLYILVEVSDDGIGVGEEHLDRIFERFYRTDTGRSRDHGGTGLGLAICKHIIEAHKQLIHVRSKPNVGTTIGFTLQGKRDI